MRGAVNNAPSACSAAPTSRRVKDARPARCSWPTICANSETLRRLKPAVAAPQLEIARAGMPRGRR